MAVDYCKILTELKSDFAVIGRGGSSARIFKEKTGLDVITGGVEIAIKENAIPGRAIVATGVEQLATTVKILMNAGVKHILVEKPGGFYQDIEELAGLAEKFGVNLRLAYNRRYFASVIAAKEMITADGGVVSFNFEFTEWAHTIEPLQKGEGVKEQWFLANSSHVVDLAFYLGGQPINLSSFVNGSLSWHPSASNFAGAGVTKDGALFSYHSNWNAPGRWGVEILTDKRRLIFRPMEKLHIQKKGSVAIEEFVTNDELDKKFKPGLFLQVKDFLDGKGLVSPDINEQLGNLKWYRAINFGTKQ
jgi:predicted dehydrogenase